MPICWLYFSAHTCDHSELVQCLCSVTAFQGLGGCRCAPWVSSSPALSAKVHAGIPYPSIHCLLNGFTPISLQCEVSCIDYPACSMFCFCQWHWHESHLSTTSPWRRHLDEVWESVSSAFPKLPFLLSSILEQMWPHLLISWKPLHSKTFPFG